MNLQYKDKLKFCVTWLPTGAWVTCHPQDFSPEKTPSLSLSPTFPRKSGSCFWKASHLPSLFYYRGPRFYHCASSESSNGGGFTVASCASGGREKCTAIYTADFYRITFVKIASIWHLISVENLSHLSHLANTNKFYFIACFIKGRFIMVYEVTLAILALNGRTLSRFRPFLSPVSWRLPVPGFHFTAKE